MKKQISLLLILVAILVLSGCSKSEEEGNSNKFSTAMVTDTGGVYDQSFNMSSWQGMSRFAKNTGAKVSYVESRQSSDYPINMDRLADENVDLIWAIGFSLADVLKRAAETNPELNYAIIDYSYGEDTLENVTGVVFRAEEAAFLAGYVAGKSTKTCKIGFIGGIASIVVDQFEYGYRAGIDYAAKERGVDIEFVSQYAESFSDAAKGKAIALKMYSNGCDIVFHAAGGVGIGLIEAAKETNNFAIGVDMDQSYLAPKNVLTSALKNAGKAVEIVSTKAMNGEKIGGQTLSFGSVDGCVGLSESTQNIDPKVYVSAMKLQDKISAGEIVPPANANEYAKFRETYINN